jgi:hypothetical protein
VATKILKAILKIANFCLIDYTHYTPKTLKTDIGDIPLDITRERNSSFDPVIVPKHLLMSAKIECKQVYKERISRRRPDAWCVSIKNHSKKLKKP